MAYYDYFKNAKPVYDMPSYSDVQGGVQGQAISGRSTYKPYSETVRTQAAALPAYYEQARARDWQTQQGVLAQQGIDIEKDKLKQSTIESESAATQREKDLDLQRKQNQWYKRMGYAGLGVSALKATAPVWAPYATGLFSGGTGIGGAFAGSAPGYSGVYSAAEGFGGLGPAAAGTPFLEMATPYAVPAYMAYDAWKQWTKDYDPVSFPDRRGIPTEFVTDESAEDVFGIGEASADEKTENGESSKYEELYGKPEYLPGGQSTETESMQRPEATPDDFASTYESVYGESYQAGSGQKNDDKSTQQAVAIGR